MADDKKVTRISANDDSSKQVTPQTGVKKPVQKSKVSSKAKKHRSFGPLGAVGGYFKGAWKELRQVHWPTRRATWGLTGAVLAFSAFFVVFITLLDAGFKFLFEQILGS